MTHLAYVAIAFVCFFAILGAVQLIFRLLNKWHAGAGPAFIVIVIIAWIVVGIVVGLMSDHPQVHTGFEPSPEDLGCLGPPTQIC